MAHQRLKPNILISVFLLAFLLKWLRFYFGSFETESLAIGRAEFKNEEVTVNFFKCCL